MVTYVIAITVGVLIAFGISVFVAIKNARTEMVKELANYLIEHRNCWSIRLNTLICRTSYLRVVIHIRSGAVRIESLQPDNVFKTREMITMHLTAVESRLLSKLLGDFETLAVSHVFSGRVI